MLEGIIKSKSKTFLTFCFCFLAGIALASVLEIQIERVYLYFSIFIFVSLLVVFWKNQSARFISFLFLIGFLGFVRYLFAFPTEAGNHISFLSGNQTLVGYVASEPDVRTDGVRYVVKAEKILSLAGGGEDSLSGRVYLKSGLYPRYQYGDNLKLKCELKKPEPFDGFRYDMYLAKERIFVTCDNPEIEKLSGQSGNKILVGIFALKNLVADRINLLWHEPQASFMAGLLYGYRGGLGELNELFSKTGVTHIVAISGYNISIIASILIAICLNLSVPRKRAFWLIVFGICGFVLFAGAGASVVRAGVMGIIVLLAKQLGRLSVVGNIMALTAVLMCLHNPFILIWDIGFQLSFVATLGLVYISPVLAKYFAYLPPTFGLQESVVSTMAAIIATLPLIAYNFGRVSVVAPIVNILILWLIPAIMLAGFLAVVFSFIFYPLGQVVAWMAWVGLEYVISIVKWFAGLSFASVNFELPVYFMLGLYFLLIWYLYKHYQKIKYKKMLEKHLQ